MAVIAKTHAAGLAFADREATSYWDITDVFEEGGFAFANNSFNGNFGLINVHGVPKPAYRSFELLHELGNELFEATVTGDSQKEPAGGCGSTVGVLASKSNSSVLSVLLFSQAPIGQPIEASCAIDVTIDGFKVGDTNPSGVVGSIRRIDATHTAPKNLWMNMGLPQWPTPAQNAAIFAASLMAMEPLPIGRGIAGTLAFTVDIPANSVVAVQIPLGGKADLLAARLYQDRLVVLASAEARAAAANAEAAELKVLLATSNPV